ncbi:MAG TPA: hypothetical protein VGM56_01015 [Byssovorax sp.]|jgi:hypothetical protein
MATTTKNRLPDCGLYRTTKPLPGHEERIPAGALVYFHNHSDKSGVPSVLAGDHNVMNRWHFHGPPIEVRGFSWAESLEATPPEGFYTLRRALNFDGGTWPKATIVQLGYTLQAEPILFIARQRGRLDENDLFFSNEGIMLKRDQLNILEQAVVFIEQQEGHVSNHADH